MKEIIVSGIAENSKAGAVVITKENETYFVDGLNSWNNDFYRKIVEVQGILEIEIHNEEMLMNDKGEYRQGLSGEVKKIVKPKWKLIVLNNEKDVVIEKISNLLPQGWNLKISNKQLFIVSSEKAYILHENKINAPVNTETEQQREERLKKYGQQTECRFVFTMSKKLTNDEIKKIKSENNKINTSIAERQKKLKSIPFSPKDGSYRPRNKDEEKMISDFEKEKTALENKLIKLPDYQTEKYALYLESEIGRENEYTSVFPIKKSEEMYKIKQEILDQYSIN